MTAILLALCLAGGPAWGDDRPPPVDASGEESVEPSPRVGTAASPPVEPRRAPLYERPLDVAVWAFFWLPEHWRLEAVHTVVTALLSMAGFVGSALTIGADPARYHRADPRHWLARAFAAIRRGGPVVAVVDDSADEIADLKRRLLMLERTQKAQQQQQATLQTTLSGVDLSAVDRLNRILGAPDA